MFFYDPKLKAKLPYYDRFPLVLPLENYSDGFLGLNFHYLPIPLRMRLLDRVVDFSNNTKFDETTTLNVSYNALKNIRLVRPTIKRYLAGKVKSRFRRIDADEFTIATLLPVARFSKASARRSTQRFKEDVIMKKAKFSTKVAIDHVKKRDFNRKTPNHFYNE